MATACGSRAGPASRAAAGEGARPATRRGAGREPRRRDPAIMAVRRRGRGGGRRRRGHAGRRRRQRREGRAQLGRARVPVGRRLGQQPLEDSVQRGRHRLAQPAGGGDRIAQPFGDDRLRGGSGVGRLAGEQLVEHAAQAVEVGPAVERGVAQRLLGTHVGRRAEGEAGLGEAVVGAGLERAGDAEVGEQRRAARRSAARSRA